MNKLLSILLFSASMLTLHSCDTDEDDPTTPIAGYDLVKSVTRYGETDTYTYDAQGRVIRQDRSDGSYTTLAYTTGQLTFTAFDSTGQQDETGVYQLNSDGYLLSGEGASYTYNSDGRLLTESYTSEGETDVFTREYTNGNITRSSRNGSTTDYTTYTYLTDKVETRLEGIQVLLGKPTYNLLSSATSYYDGESPSTGTYSYTYDSKNRVISQTSTASGGGSSVSTFTYFD